MNQLEIYRGKNGETQLEVSFEDDTVWLSQSQMAVLFRQTKQNISLHVNNCFKEKELSKKATVKESLTVQKEGSRLISRKVTYFNLDVIISVGYRVKSRQGTQFRQWATARLKEHIIQGYTVNKTRLDELKQIVNVIRQTGISNQTSADESRGLLDVITNYTQTFILLNQFDSNRLAENPSKTKVTYEIRYQNAIEAVEKLKETLIRKKEASELFGKQKDESFKGILNTIVQTFGGEYLYPGLETQAAHLLYFVIKNHPFSDGNKRIGAFYSSGFCN